VRNHLKSDHNHTGTETRIEFAVKFSRFDHHTLIHVLGQNWQIAQGDIQTFDIE